MKNRQFVLALQFSLEEVECERELADKLIRLHSELEGIGVEQVAHLLADVM